MEHKGVAITIKAVAVFRTVAVAVFKIIVAKEGITTIEIKVVVEYRVAGLNEAKETKEAMTTEAKEVTKTEVKQALTTEVKEGMIIEELATTIEEVAIKIRGGTIRATIIEAVIKEMTTIVIIINNVVVPTIIEVVVVRVLVTVPKFVVNIFLIRMNSCSAFSTAFF